VKEDTEEKALPATEKKLRDARRKRGQVAHSKDLVTAVSLLVMLAYLSFAWPGIRDQIVQLLDAVSGAGSEPFAQIQGRAISLALRILVTTGASVAALVLVATVAAGIAATGGLVFSFELVSPKISHINPVEGAKRIFSLRNIVEFAKGLIKIATLAIAFWLALRGFLQPLFEMPVCGERCLGPMTVAMLKPLAVTGAFVFMAIGLVDVLIQRQLFLRDMRMTRTEYKREQKDLEGDPLIRTERRRVARSLSIGQTRTGIRHAVVAVAHDDRIVGLRYKAGETPVPTVVSKGVGEDGLRMLAEARELGIPVVDDAALALALAENHTVGKMIQSQYFRPVAEILLKTRRL
jgi:type III secretion protein U